MEELNSFICKTCGARLDVLSAVDGVLKCEYCGNLWTVHKPETNREAVGFLQIGEHDLDTCKFDDAFIAYKKASELDANEPEAYFGMALSEFRVQYIKDGVNKRVQPICHINSDKTIEAKRFSENKYYQKALELATHAQRNEYRKKAEEIDRIREEFLKLKNKGVDYDCFICVKVSDGRGGRTSDYQTADEIYTDLKRRGYKPFFSERELETQTGSDYEAYILYALYSSECMLVVCSNEEYLNTPWVKNEYTRFLSMIADEHKESDSITIVFKGNPIEYLPGKRGKIQGINRSALDAVNRIREYVEAHSPEGKKRREAEEAKRAEAERKIREEQEQFRKQFEEQSKMFEEQNKLFEEKIRNIRNADSAPTGTATVNSLIKRAQQFLKDGDTNNATTYFNRALDADPESGEAWWGLFLIDFKAKDEKSLLKNLDWKLAQEILNNGNYKKAVNYANGAFKEYVTAFKAEIQSPQRWWTAFLNEMGRDVDNIIHSLKKADLERIKQSKNYANAKKFADEKFKQVITEFEELLDSSTAHWKLFLEDMGVVKTDPFRPEYEEIIERLTSSMLADIESNEHYIKACKKMGDDEDTQETIECFQDSLYSAIFWLKRFFKLANVKNEEQFLKKRDAHKYMPLESDNNFALADKYADGELRERIDKFKAKVASFDFLYNCFLGSYNADSADTMISKLYRISDIASVKDDKFLNEALSVANDEQKQKVQALLEKVEQLQRNYDIAIEYKDKLFKEYNCDTEQKLLLSKRHVSKSDNYNKAYEYAKLSQDRELQMRLFKLAEKHQKAIAERKGKQKTNFKFTLIDIFSITGLILNIAFTLGTILAWCRVGPLGEYWYVWANTIAGNWLTIVLFIVSLGGIILGLCLARGGISLIAALAYFIVCLAVAGSLVMLNLPMFTEKSNLYFEEDYIVSFKKEDDGLGVASFYYKGKKSEWDGLVLVVPEKINDKEVVAVRRYAFYGSKLVSQVVLPDSVKTIRKKAFYKCEKLETISLGSELESIEAKAFCKCWGLKRINYNNTTFQWGKVEKYNKKGNFWISTAVMDWDKKTGNYTVYCTDGQVSKAAGL